MIRDIQTLLHLFNKRVPDPETHAWVSELAVDCARWPEAHEVFDRIRQKNLAAAARKDRVSECQYCFEEVCLQSLFNETDTDAPFDSSSPHSITKNALALARAVGIPDTEVISIIAPRDTKG